LDWDELYTEVRRRKITALNKIHAVKAVEKHAGLLVLDGVHEKAGHIFDFIYANKKKIVEDRVEIGETIDAGLDEYNMIIVGCPGSNIPEEKYDKLELYVRYGGWLLCTDWCLQYIIENIFPGYITQGGERTKDAVVTCQITLPNHPFLEGVLSELQQIIWSKSKKKKDKEQENDLNVDEFKWWIEYRSFPIKVLRPDLVDVLIASLEIEEQWGEAPVLVCFDYGKGKVIHMISHAHLQKGSEKGKYVSAMIITNILELAVAQKPMRPPEIRLEAPKDAPQYSSDTEPRIQLEAPKAAPQYTSDTEPKIQLEAPKAAPQYTDDYEKKPEIRLEAPKAAPQYTDDYEKKPEIRLEAPKAAPQYTSNWLEHLNVDSKAPSELRLDAPKAPSEIRLEAPKAAPQYKDNLEMEQKSTPQVPLEEAWVAPPVLPPKPSKPSDPGLSSTSMIFEAENPSLDELCASCLTDFKNYAGIIYTCKECKCLYHDNCLEVHIDEGKCVNCERILLW